jgi:MFS family permease
MTDRSKGAAHDPMRPLDGWPFGYLADHYGRRLSLTLSVVGMCFGSLPHFAERDRA